jgi:hypothetical protein
VEELRLVTGKSLDYRTRIDIIGNVFPLTLFGFFVRGGNYNAKAHISSCMAGPGDTLFCKNNLR